MADSQDTPDPDKARIPSAKLRGFFRNLINWAAGMQPLSGAGIRVDQYPGKGCMISLDKSTAGISSGSGTSSLSVTDGSTTVTNVTTITFDGTLFTVTNGGSGNAEVALQTESCP